MTLDDLASDEVGVVSSGRGMRPRDLHVLRSLVGKKGSIEFMNHVMSDVTVLGVSDGWLRVSCAAKATKFGKPKVEAKQDVQLIDLADVCAIAVDGEE